MPRFLGLDSSTQSLSAVIVDTDGGEVVAAHDVAFGERLPKYRSPKGFLANDNPNLKHSDPLMWVDALEMLLDDLRKTGVDLGRIAGVSGAGQQHGSVYLNRRFDDAAGWKVGTPLREQIRPLLSRATSPMWMDSATTRECSEIAAAVGGHDRVVALTGSRAIERFTGPQIRKFFKESPAAWERTAEIHLVSSFMASVLVGRTSSIDLGDGAGMNLLDLAKGRWSQTMLDATAPGLGKKLPAVVPSATRIGTVAQYFVEKYGFAKDTPVIAFTGDNPSSLVGMGATRPGTAVIRLGTSDTVFAAMAAPRIDPNGYGHVFGNPAGGFMSLVCFSNGALARERIADRFGLGWDDFARAILGDTRPGNDGNLVLPYFVPEITPRLLDPEPRWFGSEAFVSGHDGAAAARGVVEAQALGMRRYSQWIGETMDTVLVTGGASKNAGILRVLADVFQTRIVPLAVTNSSALGGALRAANAVAGVPWDDLYRRFSAPETRFTVTPNPGSRAPYQDLAAQFERRIAEMIARNRTTF